MNSSAQLGRLVWKDVRTLRPLLISAVIAALVFNLVLVAFLQTDEFRNSTFIGWSIALWIIIPGFVALGAPAMLVGTEQEERTIEWLRTLPIRWQQIAASKFWAAVAAVMITWLLATILMWLMSLGWQRAAPTLFHLDSDKYYVGGQSLLSLPFVSLILFDLALLVLLGFNLVYAIRYPLPALLALIPVFTIAAYTGSFLLVMSGLSYWHSALIAIGVLFILWATQHLLAKVRLVNPARRSVSTLFSGATPTTYRPTSSFSVHSRPSQVTSLLWQQLRQTGPLSVALVVGALVLFILFSVSRVEPGERTGIIPILGAMAPVFVVLSSSWLGAVVFYGDNVRSRRGFFSDRGISPTRVWWTRLFPPAATYVFMMAMATLIVMLSPIDYGARARTDLLNVVALTIVLFAFGQLVSQWSQRPLLAFFAAPAYAFASLAPVFYMMDRFNAGFVVIILVAPVLLFASWRLTYRWLESEVDIGYTLRVLGYTLAAVLVPCLWIAARELFFFSAYFIASAN